MPVLIHTGRRAENPHEDFRPACLLRVAPPSPFERTFHVRLRVSAKRFSACGH